MKIASAIALLRKTQVRTYRKGEIIIKEGETEKTVLFIRKGLVRSYILDPYRLEEITFQLYPENNVVVNLHSILFDDPCRFIYEALEDTKAYHIDYQAWLELTAINSEFLELNRSLIGRNAMKRAFQRVESFVFLSPEQRYGKYIKDHPKLVNRAPDKYIANILGITPVSLSRIRSRIANRMNQ